MEPVLAGVRMVYRLSRTTCVLIVALGMSGISPGAKAEERPGSHRDLERPSVTFIKVPEGLGVELTAVRVTPDARDDKHVTTSGSSVLIVRLEDGREIQIVGIDLDIAKVLQKSASDQRDAFRRGLQEIGRKDKAIREEFALREGQVRSEAMDAVAVVDAENQERLSALIGTYGWPSLSVVGEEASRATFLVLQHSNIAYRGRYLPLVREAAYRGEFRSDLLAMLEDRQLVEEGKPQRYGTQFSTDALGKPGSSHPVADPEGLVERRRRAGL